MTKQSPQSNTSKKTNREVHLLAPTQGYRRYLRFNRFQVDSIDNGKILQCAFATDTGIELCRYSAFVSIADLQNNTPQVGPYLGEIGHTPPPSAKWAQGVPWSVPSSAPMDMIRHFSLARAGENGEIGLFSFPVGAVLNGRKSQQDKSDAVNAISIDPIALLSSSLDAHVAILLELFSDIIEKA